MIKKFKPAEEWLKQAEYDFETAQAMFSKGRYIYTIFMCHLSIEKGLKGLYALVYKKDAPKTHNLNYLVEKISVYFDINLSDEHDEFLKLLNEKSIPTRYPEDLKVILKDFNKAKTNKNFKTDKGFVRVVELKIQKLKRIIEKHFESSRLKLDKIILFGSYAEGKQKTDSDIDILLISRSFRNKNYDDRFIPILDLNKELVKNLDKPVDLLYYSDEEWENDQSLIIREAKQHGKVIYG